jgi:hypothetical protein
LRNAFLALLDQREAILADVLRLLDDRAFRRDVVVRVYSPRVRDFWLREYESYPVHFRAEAVAPIQNKVGAFLAHPILNRILCEGTSSFVLRRMMDQRKILLVNLAKGKIGEDAATLLGALLISSMGVAALSRAEIAESERKDFFVYLDEFQNFTTLSLANMLSELRKYRVGMILTHQYLNQIEHKCVSRFWQMRERSSLSVWVFQTRKFWRKKCIRNSRCGIWSISRIIRSI